MAAKRTKATERAGEGSGMTLRSAVATSGLLRSFGCGTTLRGMLLAGLLAMIGNALLVSCRRAADPRQLATVDSLITTMEAARLTLHELDTQHYATADSILQGTRARFLQRFSDTLDKNTATVLGNQFIALRETGQRATDHRMVVQAVHEAGARLARLRHDVSSGALSAEDAATAIASETAASETVEQGVLQVITNHQATQRALEQQAMVDSLLADTLTPHHPHR